MITTINRVAGAMLATAGLTGLLLADAPGAAASTIFACVKQHGGTTHLVSKTAKCKKGETKLSWNSQGPRGANGSQGAAGSPGTPGSQGHEGPQGPGATSFTATLPEGTIGAVLIKLSNGLVVSATCFKGNVQPAIETPGANNLDASGTSTEEGLIRPIDSVAGSGIIISSKTSADFDVIAADRTIGKFARIDIHGAAGSPCTFWGMITPTS